MRLLLIALLFAASSAARAQSTEQETKRMNEILSPNTAKSVPEQTKSFYGGKQFETGSGAELVKPFYFTQIFQAKAFSTKEFTTSKHWEGDFKFSTKSAATGSRFLIPGIGKSIDTKAAGVKEAPEAGKGYASRNFEDVHEVVMHGASQNGLDEQQKKAPMTIDQVRDLLNKSK